MKLVLLQAINLLLTSLAIQVNAEEAADQKPLQQNNVKKPNIVVILTDDQDLHMQSLDYMPLVNKHITEKGTFFKRHYCSTALCCPSRVTLWTGKHSHNTNVTDVHPPYGGYPKFVAQGHNSNWLPVWLQAAGYSTFYTGKLFNAHNVANYDSPFPAGWTGSDFLLDPYTYEYLNATFQRDRETPVSHEGEYSTDVLAAKGYGLLDEAVALGKPFFLALAPIAAHSNVASSLFNGGRDAARYPFMTEPVPAERHKHLFPDAKVPRTENFNPDTPGGASWIKRLSQLNDSSIASNDLHYRRRLQSLQAVDELVGGLVARLDSHGVLADTFLIYTTDNGFHVSQHRLPPGKQCAFEEDVNIPFIVRGPGVRENATTELVTGHTDFAPTVMALALAGSDGDGDGDGDDDDDGRWRRRRAEWDGEAMPLTEGEVRRAEEAAEAEEGGHRREHVVVEYWGSAIPEGTGGYSLDEGKWMTFGLNNTYKALRVIGKEYDLFYAVWCTNEHELYDMKNDPQQLHNIYPNSSAAYETQEHQQQPADEPLILGLPLSTVVPRLDALLMVVKSCKGATCIDPWSPLHPTAETRTRPENVLNAEGPMQQQQQQHSKAKRSVKTLKDALDPRFDGFYAWMGTRVRFDRCEMGYVLDAEGPQEAIAFDVTRRY